MTKASVRDLHIRTSEFVREAAEGGIIVIERRGEPVAELRPLSKKQLKPNLPDMQELWSRFPSVTMIAAVFSKKTDRDVPGFGIFGQVLYQ